ncbi:MAG TPA: flagellar biosynthetic protein FliP [Firmicutes bacterium]|nr:flagellar biosynthetic protein FliP [Bacillota bacterium]
MHFHKFKIGVCSALLVIALAAFLPGTVSVAFAQPALPIPDINLQIGTGEEPQQLVGTLQLLLILAVLSLAPAFIILMTSFTRMVIVLGFLRNALGTQQIPPNQIIIGLALFLTFFVMQPIFSQIHTDALTPYLAEEIDFAEALARGERPLREFMLNNTREEDLMLFLQMARIDVPVEREDVPFRAVVPAFVLSELKTAFQIGFLLFVPFLIIDMIVSSVLMSMGMFMLPPVIVSLPFKILLFVLVDGWTLVVRSLVEGYA